MLQINDPYERGLVRVADAALGVVSRLGRGLRHRVRPPAPQRILLLRLERIGDLVMALPAIRAVRALAPSAEIDLVVGSWNASLAGAIPDVNRVLTLDARWLAREAGGQGLPALLRSARQWRSRKYDLAINFEPDVRSNLLLANSGAGWTGGWASAGGGPLLDEALEYDPRAHTTANMLRLITTIFGRQPETSAPLRLAIPDPAMRAAQARLGVGKGPLVGIHASGGRAIKQWDPERFATVAARLADDRHAVIVLTGGPTDRDLIDHVKELVAPRRVIDASGDIDLLELAALLQRMDLFITGDTGPMHLAAAMGTPVVAVFGPSAPERYAPTGAHDRIVRIDLPCSPCNRIRRPPDRCVGHTPDCLVGVTVDAVFAAASEVLDASAMRMPRARV